MKTTKKASQVFKKAVLNSKICVPRGAPKNTSTLLSSRERHSILVLGLVYWVYIWKCLIEQVGPMRYVNVITILEAAAWPRELIQVNGVKFIKLLLQSAIS